MQKKLAELMNEIKMQNGSECYGFMTFNMWAEKLIENGVIIPIRCKDCKYWQDNNGGYPHTECRWGHGETPDENDYCSYAERKDKQ